MKRETEHTNEIPCTQFALFAEHLREIESSSANNLWTIGRPSKKCRTSSLCAVRVTERSQSSMGAMHSSLRSLLLRSGRRWGCVREREAIWARYRVFPSYSHLGHYYRLCIPNSIFIHFLLCLGALAACNDTWEGWTSAESLRDVDKKYEMIKFNNKKFRTWDFLSNNLNGEYVIRIFQQNTVNFW